MRISGTHMLLVAFIFASSLSATAGNGPVIKVPGTRTEIQVLFNEITVICKASKKECATIHLSKSLVVLHDPNGDEDEIVENYVSHEIEETETGVILHITTE